MNHREDLKALIDHELSPQRAMEVREAVEKDILLQAELHEMETIGQAIRDLAVQPEPVGLENTLKALEANAKPAPWWTRLPGRLTLGTLSGAAVLALAIMLVPRLSSPPTGSTEDAASTGTVAAAAKHESILDKPSVMSNSAIQMPAGGATVESPASPKAASVPPTAGSAGKAVPLNMKVADVTLLVGEVGKTETTIRTMVTKLKGTVEVANIRNRSYGGSDADFVVRVPQSELKTFLKSVKEQGAVLNDAFNEQNVEPQVNELQENAAAQDQTAQDLKDMERRAKLPSDQLQIQKERLRAEQKGVQARTQMRTLKSQVAMATVRLHLTTRTNLPGSSKVKQRPK